MFARHLIAAAALGCAILGANSALAQHVVVEPGPVSACVQPELGLRETRDGQLIQHWALRTPRSLGECGCRSAVMSYSTRAATSDGDEVLLQQGIINTLASSTSAITLSADADMAKKLAKNSLILSLSCAPSR